MERSDKSTGRNYLPKGKAEEFKDGMFRTFKRHSRVWHCVGSHLKSLGYR